MAGPSNYPNGFTQGITIRGLPIKQVHPGEVFWVNNSSVPAKGAVGGSDGNDGSYRRPLSTIDGAIGKCTADRGDIIIVMPGHAETVAAASGITLDVAGVAIIGLGSGAKRPTLTFSATDSTVVISAANCSVSNIIFEAGIADVVTALSLTGDADGTSFENIESYEGAAAGTYNFVDVITIATGANNLSFRDSVFIGNDTNNDAFITGVAHDGFYVDNCIFYQNVAQAAAHGLVVSSGNVTNAEIKNCSFRSNIDDALWLDFHGAANSGVCKNCVVSSIDTLGATSKGDFTGGHFFECYVSGDADAFGLIGGGGVVYANT
jgi:hypothetical protein